MVESHTFVGIASFNGKGEIRAQLHQINSDDDRKLLVSYLPAAVSAEAEASVCSGLKKGFEVRWSTPPSGHFLAEVASGVGHLFQCGRKCGR